MVIGLPYWDESLNTGELYGPLLESDNLLGTTFMYSTFLGNLVAIAPDSVYATIVVPRCARVTHPTQTPTG